MYRVERVGRGVGDELDIKGEQSISCCASGSDEEISAQGASSRRNTRCEVKSQCNAVMDSVYQPTWKSLLNIPCECRGDDNDKKERSGKEQGVRWRHASTLRQRDSVTLFLASWLRLQRMRLELCSRSFFVFCTN